MSVVANVVEVVFIIIVVVVSGISNVLEQGLSSFLLLLHQLIKRLAPTNHSPPQQEGVCLGVVIGIKKQATSSRYVRTNMNEYSSQ